MSEEPWIEWAGGKRPVDGDVRVEVRHRSGEVSSSYIDNPRYGGDNRAVTWCWHHGTQDEAGDIVAYRLTPSSKGSDHGE